MVLTFIPDFLCVRHCVISFNLYNNLRGRYFYNIIIENQDEEVTSLVAQIHRYEIRTQVFLSPSAQHSSDV